MALTIIVVILVAFTTWLIFPPEDISRDADVVMVVAGASDGRHELGAEIVRELGIPHFVVSNPKGDEDEKGASFCHGAQTPRDTQIWCLNPDPVTTAGEAMGFEMLAKKQGWESAIIVTNRPHSRRVTRIFTDCTTMDIHVTAIHTINMGHLPYHVAREAGGFAKYFLTDPCGT